MTIQTNTTDRRALVNAIAEELHTEARYLRTPTYAYQIGDFTVDRDGNIIGEDFTPLHDFLLRHEYITEEPETPTEDLEAEATENTDDAEPEAPAKVEPETASTETDIDTQSITIPAPGITVEQLRNLTYTLYSRQYILNLMTGGDTIQIPDAMVESLKNTLPETPECFSDFLQIYRGFGLKGFDFKDGQFTLTFPFYETEPTKWTTFAGLQGRILQAAMAATRVFPEILKPEEEAEKYTAHMWLQRLGYKGAEMKEQRNILTKHLHGYCAFSNGAKMQNHKDKYAAIRRERREAERAAEAAAQTVTVTTDTTSEAQSPEVADAKEVC